MHPDDFYDDEDDYEEEEEEYEEDYTNEQEEGDYVAYDPALHKPTSKSNDEVSIDRMTHLDIQQIREIVSVPGMSDSQIMNVLVSNNYNMDAAVNQLLQEASKGIVA